MNDEVNTKHAKEKCGCCNLRQALMIMIGSVFVTLLGILAEGIWLK